MKEFYNNNEDEGIELYLKVLISEDYGFYTDEPELFPNMELAWETPFKLTNSIIDFDSGSNHDIKHIISEISELGCYSLLLRFYHSVSENHLQKILDEITSTSINSVNLVLKFNDNILEKIEPLCSAFPFLRSVTFYDAPENDFNLIKDLDIKILCTQVVIDSEKLCGVVDKSLFTINTQHFSESQEYNSCLNCKLSIDKNGFVKNCPSMNKNFGQYGEKPLKEIIKDKDYTSVWHINKDKINGCKDCEFRHVCTDCRAYTVVPNDPYSKPLKCNYDPYTATWV